MKYSFANNNMCFFWKENSMEGKSTDKFEKFKELMKKEVPTLWGGIIIGALTLIFLLIIILMLVL